MYAVGIKDRETGRVMVSRGGRRFDTAVDAATALLDERDSKWFQHVVVDIDSGCYSLVGQCGKPGCEQCRGR